ncbi:LysM peptidoglycan-binding domain-containing protein [Bacillus velezensis]|uniref:LysM peptidoglycan-binding domain-containing protein n=1 Tax=Bacillus velezensis TaxID=492670 RepID=UPI003EB9DC0E
MAEFERVHGHTPAHGGDSHPSGGGKKFQLNKKTIIMFGVAGIGVFLLMSLMTRGQTEQEQTEDVSDDYIDGNPMNSSMVQAQLQNHQGIVENDVETALNSFANEIGQNQSAFRDDVIEHMTDIGKENKDYADKIQKDLRKQLDEQNKKNQSMITHLEDELKKKAATPPKTSTPAKTTPKTTPKTPTQKYKTVTVKKGDTLSELTQKYGKGGTKKAYTETAKFNGIKDPNKIKVGQKIKILQK